MTQEEQYQQKLDYIWNSKYSDLLSCGYSETEAQIMACQRVTEWADHCRRYGDPYGERYAIPNK